MVSLKHAQICNKIHSILYYSYEEKKISFNCLYKYTFIYIMYQGKTSDMFKIT